MLHRWWPMHPPRSLYYSQTPIPFSTATAGGYGVRRSRPVSTKPPAPRGPRVLHRWWPMHPLGPRLTALPDLRRLHRLLDLTDPEDTCYLPNSATERTVRQPQCHLNEPPPACRRHLMGRGTGRSIISGLGGEGLQPKESRSVRRGVLRSPGGTPVPPLAPAACAPCAAGAEGPRVGQAGPLGGPMRLALGCRGSWGFPGDLGAAVALLPPASTEEPG